MPLVLTKYLYSQEETETFFDKHNSKAQQRKQSVTLFITE